MSFYSPLNGDRSPKSALPAAKKTPGGVEGFKHIISESDMSEDNCEARLVYDVLDRQLGRLVERGVPRSACQTGTLAFTINMLAQDLGRDAAVQWLRGAADALEDDPDLVAPTHVDVGHA